MTSQRIDVSQFALSNFAGTNISGKYSPYRISQLFHYAKQNNTMQPKDEPTDAEEDLDDTSTNEISSDDDGKKSDSKGKKRANPSSLTEEDKRAERRAANRRSAFQSRQRRKILIEDLQRTVAALSKDNGDLRKSNEELRVQLEATLLENHQFRVQQQLAGAQGNHGAGFLGSSALQSAQAQALLRSGGQTALSQLLGGGSASGPAPTPSQNQATNSEHLDPIFSARLALAAAQARGGDTLSQSQAPTPGAAPTSSSIQSFFESGNVNGAMQGGNGTNPNQLSGLQSLLQNAASSQNPQLAALFENAVRNGVAGPPASAAGGANGNPGQLTGLQGILDQLFRGGAPGQGSSGAPAPAGLNELQRALLQGNAGNPTGQTQMMEKNNTVSDTLRALLQKNC